MACRAWSSAFAAAVLLHALPAWAQTPDVPPAAPPAAPLAPPASPPAAPPYPYPPAYPPPYAVPYGAPPPYPAPPPYGAPQPYAAPYPYVAPPAAYSPAQRERRGPVRVSSGAMAGGIVALTLGGILAATGGPLLLAHESQSCTTNGQGFDCTSPGRSIYIGLLVSGAITASIGIGLIAYGARYETPDETARRVLPAWAGAPSRMGWGWSM